MIWPRLSSNSMSAKRPWRVPFSSRCGSNLAVSRLTHPNVSILAQKLSLITTYLEPQQVSKFAMRAARVPCVLPNFLGSTWAMLVSAPSAQLHQQSSVRKQYRRFGTHLPRCRASDPSRTQCCLQEELLPPDRKMSYYYGTQITTPWNKH